jgi:hypothetical protein
MKPWAKIEWGCVQDRVGMCTVNETLSSVNVAHNVNSSSTIRVIILPVHKIVY